MYIEKETYLIKPFLKKSFLNQSISTFSDNLGNADINKVMSIIQENKTKLLPSKLITKNKKQICSVFNVVGNSITRDNHVSKEELYKFIKGYYKRVKGQDVTDEQIDNLRVFDMIDIFVIWTKDFKDEYFAHIRNR